MPQNIKKNTFQLKTGISISVNLTAFKRKEGSSYCLYLVENVFEDPQNNLTFKLGSTLLPYLTLKVIHLQK